MAFETTQEMELAALQSEKTPVIVLQIDGIDRLITASGIQKYIRYGDEGLFYGDGAVYGGVRQLDNQDTYISYQSGTTTKITQTIYPDKGTGETVSGMQVAIVDKNQEITKLLQPGNIVEDIMGRRSTIWFGYLETPWPDSYIRIFKGKIDDRNNAPGLITLNISSPDQQKRGEIFLKAETELSSDVLAADSVINVTTTNNFLAPVLGPDGTRDYSLTFFIRINDELIEYEVTTANQFQTLTRGSLGTIAADHSAGDAVESFYRLEGNAIDLALKLMLSGSNGPYLEDVPVTNFVRISSTETVADSIYFDNLKIVNLYNVQVGDYITTTGATNGANNVTLQEITGILELDDGSYITCSGAGFVEEVGSSAIISFRSKYDTLGEGLAMSSDDVDVAQHEYIKGLFLSSFDYDFYLKDTIVGKEFISEQIYNPASAFALPRGSRSSLGYHFPPLPNTTIKTLSSSNVMNANKLSLRRTTTQQFYNHIIYKYEEEVLEEKFDKGLIRRSEDSLNRIPVGNKPLTIESKGLREILSADNNTLIASERRLKKYRYAAESIKSVKVQLGTGYNLDPGDVVLVDMTSLKVGDIYSGTRRGEARLFEITNKTIDLKTGEVELNITDTSFDKDQRYGLISPASYVKLGLSSAQFIIRESFPADGAGDNEFLKWTEFVGNTVIVRSIDYSISDTSVIKSISGNTITLETALSFIPNAGYVMEFDSYNSQIDNVKLIYVYMSDDINDFADGRPYYGMV